MQQDITLDYTCTDPLSKGGRIHIFWGLGLQHFLVKLFLGGDIIQLTAGFLNRLFHLLKTYRNTTDVSYFVS